MKTNKERLAEHDLEYLFCFAEADCGIKSNYMSMVNVAIYGINSDYRDPYNTFILNSVDRKRKIENIYYSLSQLDQNILYLSFSNVKFPKYIELLYTKYTGAVCLTTQCNSKQLENLCRTFHLVNSSEKDKITIATIRIEATTNYYNAINNYYKTKLAGEK